LAFDACGLQQPAIGGELMKQLMMLVGGQTRHIRRRRFHRDHPVKKTGNWRPRKGEDRTESPAAPERAL
jgi:hypothetical protein